MNQFQSIESLIQSCLDDAIVHILDPRHDGIHLEAIVISKHFEGKTLLEQQRLVMQSLSPLFEKELHALALKTYTPEKWKKEDSNENERKN